MAGLVISDSCDPHCGQCSVANRRLPDLTFPEIERGLIVLRRMGAPAFMPSRACPMGVHEDTGPRPATLCYVCAEICYVLRLRPTAALATLHYRPRPW